MIRKDINEQSPLRILDASIHGGLGPGNLGVVMARAGVGKTACLIQISLDELMRERKVLHFALGGQTLESVRAWYDALFDDLASRLSLENVAATREILNSHRIIHCYPESPVSPEHIERTLALFAGHLSFRPNTLIVDGYDWTVSDSLNQEATETLKRCAADLGAELWMSATIHREAEVDEKTHLPEPCSRFAEAIDVALSLEPETDHVNIQILKDHDYPEPSPLTLQLQCDTMRLVDSKGGGVAPSIPRSAMTLLSGAAAGAEALFGSCAEQFALNEVHFSFSGRPVERSRGIVLLSESELEQGDVSSRYLQAHMHRSYPDTSEFRRVLQSIWHQVNTAGQVFVIGRILEDGTVKGGTGWAAELARHLSKELHVFDQNQGQWFALVGKELTAEEPPTIRSRRFTGTGTRTLNDAGREAIQSLFARSFPT